MTPESYISPQGAARKRIRNIIIERRFPDRMTQLRTQAAEDGLASADSLFWQTSLDVAIQEHDGSLITKLGTEKLLTQYCIDDRAGIPDEYRDPLLAATPTNTASVVRAVLSLPFIRVEHNNAHAFVKQLSVRTGAGSKYALYESKKATKDLLPSIAKQLDGKSYAAFLENWFTMNQGQKGDVALLIETLLNFCEEDRTKDFGYTLHMTSSTYAEELIGAIAHSKNLKAVDWLLQIINSEKTDQTHCDGLANPEAFNAGRRALIDLLRHTLSVRQVVTPTIKASLEDITHALCTGNRVYGLDEDHADKVNDTLTWCLSALPHPKGYLQKLLEDAAVANCFTVIPTLLSHPELPGACLPAVVEHCVTTAEVMLAIVEHPKARSCAHTSALLKSALTMRFCASAESLLAITGFYAPTFSKRSKAWTKGDCLKDEVLESDTVALVMRSNNIPLLRKVLSDARSKVLPTDIHYLTIALNANDLEAMKVLVEDARIDPYQSKGQLIHACRQKDAAFLGCFSGEFRLRVSPWGGFQYRRSAASKTRMLPEELDSLSFPQLLWANLSAERHNAILAGFLSQPSLAKRLMIQELSLNEDMGRALQVLQPCLPDAPKALEAAAARLEIAQFCASMNARKVLRGDNPTETAQDAILLAQANAAYTALRTKYEISIFEGARAALDTLKRIRRTVIEQLLLRCLELQTDIPEYKDKHRQLTASAEALIEGGPQGSDTRWGNLFLDSMDIYQQAFRAIFVRPEPGARSSHMYYRNALLDTSTSAYKMMLYVFQAISETTELDVYQNQLFTFLSYLGMVVRSRSVSNISEDSYACATGSFTWVAQSLRAHPDYEHLFQDARATQLESAFNACVNHHFREHLARIKGPDAKGQATFALDALTGLSVDKSQLVIEGACWAQSGERYTDSHVQYRDRFSANVMGGYEGISAHMNQFFVAQGAQPVLKGDAKDAYQVLLMIHNLGSDALSAQLASTFQHQFPTLQEKMAVVLSDEYLNPFKVPDSLRKNIPASLLAKREKQSLLYQTYLRQNPDEKRMSAGDLESCVETLVVDYPQEDIKGLMARM